MAYSGVRIGVLAVSGAFLGFCLLSMTKLVENVPASQYAVIQSPVSGDLKWYTSPGVAWQGYGDVTSYAIRMRYDFSENGYLVQFNDGGHGTIKGSIQCDLPSDHQKLTELHRKFPNQEQVETGLIKTATQGALYLVGPLMSSRESYAEKRPDLIRFVTDMVENGPYRTRQVHVFAKDPVTGQEKDTVTAEIVLDKDGLPQRQEPSAIKTFGINCYQFIINKIDYDQIVDAQIKQQQQITMNVQTSLADKVLAEQKAQTAEANGRAVATEAKWTQEAIKAKETTKAEQERAVALITADRERQVNITNALRDKEVAETAANRDKAVAETAAAQRFNVADLDKKSAEQKKQELIFLGQGEAERKKLVLDADGALTQKLDTYVKVAEVYASAMRNSRWVPEIVMGGSGASGSAANTGAVDLISLLTAKTAKDLSLDLGISGKPRATTVGQN